MRENKILLAKRASHKRWYPNCWDLVGGHAESGETLETTLVRECQEEVGLTPLIYAKIGELSEETDPEIRYHVYKISQWDGGEPQLLGDEHTELRWFDLDDATSIKDIALRGYRPLFRELSV